MKKKECINQEQTHVSFSPQKELFRLVYQIYFETRNNNLLLSHMG